METMIKETTKVFIQNSTERENLDIKIGDIAISLFGSFRITRATNYAGYLLTIDDSGGLPVSFVHIWDIDKTPIKITRWDNSSKIPDTVLEHNIVEE